MYTMQYHATTLLAVLITTTQLLLAAASPALPDPASLEPSLLFPSSGGGVSSPPSQQSAAEKSTIPAFPEQSEAAAATSVCQLAPSPPLLPAVRASCNAGGTALPPRLRCCPALAAWLYAAYAPAALSTSGRRRDGAGGPGGPWRSEAAAAEGGAVAAVVDLPVLPDDSAECAGAVDRALRAAGATLPRPQAAAAAAPSARSNGTAACDVAFCYCGVRLLRQPACGVPEGRMARRLERECARPGLAGCSGCLQALSKLGRRTKNTTSTTTPSASSAKAKRQTREDCQVLGLTWLLQRNATRYRDAATAVIRALMAADGSRRHAACSLPVDELPVAVGSSQINGAAADASSGVGRVVMTLVAAGSTLVFL